TPAGRAPAAGRVGLHECRPPAGGHRPARLSNHLACLRDCGLVVTVPDGRRTRYELADERLGHALDHLLATVLAVETDPTCTEAATQGCC
ncbi:helix-turn-helix domain-containing protein, partial [Streptomyces sp. NPDC041003]|uniref:ArsR/SmtB family transcription factor n=1 Tax=Streptomyces sp. NPDC041003 TaxID=3155730 RepID=UPI0033DA31F0